jgi:hypothetical protein
MEEKKTAETVQRIYKLYLKEKRLFEVFKKIEEITKISTEAGEIEYVNPYLSSMIPKSKISGECYGV